MKPKTVELLYFLLWTCDMLRHPTVRNLFSSFEGWAYHNGFHRHLAELEAQKFLEAEKQAAPAARPASIERVYCLTEAGRLQALGGRDPEARWSRPWDGRWRLVLFDLPVTQGAVRDRLRYRLRRRGFGYLQNSVWITPDPLEEEKDLLARGRGNVESLILLEGRPCAGETDAEIVAGAWDFDQINRLYAEQMRVVQRRPRGELRDETAARQFRRWAGEEREAWLAAVSADPLLPGCLLPRDYLGRKAWELRLRSLRAAGEQMRSFRGPGAPANKS